jgi:hypothetical protein
MGVIARHVSTLSMRLEASAPPDFLDGIEADSVMPRHQPARPMSSASGWPQTQRITNDGLLFIKAYALGPSGAGPIDQRVQAASGETLTPFGNVPQIEPGAFPGLAQRGSFAQQKHALEATSDPLWDQSRAQKFFHLLPLRGCDFQGQWLHPEQKHTSFSLSPLFNCHHTRSVAFRGADDPRDIRH